MCAVTNKALCRVVERGKHAATKLCCVVVVGACQPVAELLLGAQRHRHAGTDALALRNHRLVVTARAREACQSRLQTGCCHGAVLILHQVEQHCLFHFGRRHRLCFSLVCIRVCELGCGKRVQSRALFCASATSTQKSMLSKAHELGRMSLPAALSSWPSTARKKSPWHSFTARHSASATLSLAVPHNVGTSYSSSLASAPRSLPNSALHSVLVVAPLSCFVCAQHLVLKTNLLASGTRSARCT